MDKYVKYVILVELNNFSRSWKFNKIFNKY